MYSFVRDFTKWKRIRNRIKESEKKNPPKTIWKRQWTFFPDAQRRLHYFSSMSQFFFFLYFIILWELWPLSVSWELPVVTKFARVTVPFLPCSTGIYDQFLSHTPRKYLFLGTPLDEINQLSMQKWRNQRRNNVGINNFSRKKKNQWIPSGPVWEDFIVLPFRLERRMDLPDVPTGISLEI